MQANGFLPGPCGLHKPFFVFGGIMTMKDKEKLPATAANIARKRLEAYLSEKLNDEYDLAVWEFYTWLLEKAKQRGVDRSGYIPAAYHTDHIENHYKLSEVSHA
jgi:hypothetical protein